MSNHACTFFKYETGNVRQKWLITLEPLVDTGDGITDWGLWPRYRFAKACSLSAATGGRACTGRAETRPKPLDAQRWVSPKLWALRGSVLPGTTLT
jgi:hypothetical protein